MNTLEFISSIIKSIAWPSAIVVIAISLKNPLKKLIPNINKLTYNNLAIDFSRDLESAKQNLDGVNLTSDTNEENPNNSRTKEIIEVAKISPSASITMSWMIIEKSILALANRVSENNIKSTMQAIKKLKEKNIIDSRIENTLVQLNHLRNRAAHGHLANNLPLAVAVEYFEIVRETEIILNDIDENN